MWPFSRKSKDEITAKSVVNAKTTATGGTATGGASTAAGNALSTSKLPFFGNAPAGVFVNEDAAMRTAAVYACVRVISEAIASLPLNIYEYAGTGRRLAHEHVLYNILHNEPNPEMTSFGFRETLLNHLLIYGNAYAQILRDNSGRVVALYPLLPNKMDVRRNETGELYYTYWRGSDENRRGVNGNSEGENANSQAETGPITLRKESVLHIAGLSFDGIVGYSPIALAKSAIGLSIATEGYGASFFSNSATPSGVIECMQELSNADQIHKAWESVYKGFGKQQKVAVLDHGMTFKPVSIPPEEAQFLETRKFQLTEIARIFKVPPHMIGDLDKSSFNNIEQEGLEFLKYTLEPWVCRIEQAMCQSLLLPSEKNRYFIKFNVDGLLRGDYETRMKGYSIARQNGWMSANDIRRLEDLNEIPAEKGGDLYLVNGNMSPLERAGEAYAGKQGTDYSDSEGGVFAGRRCPATAERKCPISAEIDVHIQ